MVNPVNYTGNNRNLTIKFIHENENEKRQI